MPWPKPSSSCRAPFPPQLQWSEKEHGRITTYGLWHRSIDPSDIGLPGAARLLRIHTTMQYVRKGQIWKTTEDVSHAISSLWEHEATVQELFEAIRGHWSIENRQHYRRDRTQDEDRCGTKHTTSAQNLSLFRTLAIFLFEQQRDSRTAARSLPMYEKRIMRRPRTLIDRFTT
jgi:predicted transposase YbfD/YdcC